MLNVITTRRLKRTTAGPRLLPGLAFFGLSLPMLLDVYSAEELTARSALFQVRAALQRVRSVHYRGESTYSRFRQGEQRTDTTTYEFGFDGTTYYSNYQSARQPVTERVAFDGKFYQRLEDATGRLYLTTKIPKRPYVVQQPLLAQFGYARGDDQRLDITSIKRADHWEALAEKAVLLPTEAILGHPCRVIKTQRQNHTSGGTVEVTIHAALDLDFYPLQVTNQAEGITSTSQVTELKAFDTSSGQVVIPVTIEQISRNATGDVVAKHVYRVERDSISVNEGIDRAQVVLKNHANTKSVRNLDAPPDAKKPK